MGKIKICLVRPPILVPKHNQAAIFTPPIGVAYIAGTLLSDGHDVQIIDGLGEALDHRHPFSYDCFIYGLKLDEITERIHDDTDVIGVSAGFSFDWLLCKSLIKDIRKRFPRVLLIAGGEHVTALPSDAMAGSPIDVVVLGEGEETACHVSKAYGSGDFDPSKIAGIAYKDSNGGVVVNTRRKRIRAIDDIPWPAWDKLPIEEYIDRHYGFGVNRGRTMPMLLSRGCPYQCKFCSSPQMWTTRWLARDIDKVLDEVSYYKKKYNIDNIDFYDLTAIVKKKWIVGFCRKLKQRNMSFTWQLPSGTRSEAIDKEVAQLLYSTGCRNISLSPESGSRSVLKSIKKKISPELMLESLKGCVEAGLNVKCNMMFGFPGETHKEIRESYAFIIRMALNGAHDLSAWAFSPYPGSELFNEIAKKTSLKLNDAYYDSLRSYADSSRSVSYSEYLSDERLKKIRLIAQLIFYSISWIRYPIRPFRIIRNVIRGVEESRAEMGITKWMEHRFNFSKKRKTVTKRG